MTKLYFLAAFLLIVSNSCYYDSENYLYPKSSCDSVKGTFSMEVKPLLVRKCQNCHSNQVSSGGIILETYDQIKSNAARVLGSIEHSSGISAMPKGEPKLQDCEIKKVKTWIDAGSLNN